MARHFDVLEALLDSLDKGQECADPYSRVVSWIKIRLMFEVCQLGIKHSMFVRQGKNTEVLSFTF